LKTKKKVFVPKLDFFWKHASHCKALVVMLGVKVGGTLLFENHAHVANEKLYVAKGPKKLL